jgi:predicted exporter
MRRRLYALPVALLAAVLILVLSFRAVRVRSDLTAFLPAGHTPAARLMIEQLRDGTAASLILLGIEGAAPAELARISRSMSATLDRSGQFALVENGQRALSGPDAEFLFRHRYLLSPGTDAASFTTAALRADFRRLLAGLESSAAPLVERFALPDPTGAFLDLASIWAGDSRVRPVAGVWFAPHRDRALILASTRAGATDLIAQDGAIAAIRSAFAQAGPGPARLLISGPAVFAHDAAHAIHRDVRLISVTSALLVAALLIWRFRSPLVVAAIAVPLLLSVGAAVLVVQFAFGFVHAIALGFGMTLLGVTVDYPVLLIGHRKRGEQTPATWRRIGAAFSLAVTTASLGLLGMLFSGLPGLSQIGLFSIAGVLAAATATRWLLPPLIAAADLAPVSAGDPARTLQIEALRGWRLWGLLPIAAAVVYLVAVRGPRFETDLANLSPVPQRARTLDADLRAELSVPDVGQVLVLRGDDAEAVLRQEEVALPMLDRLRRARVIGGAEIAARYLPSAATQRTREASLPPPDVLARRVAHAQAGLGFREDAFSGFLADVAASRSMAAVTPANIASLLIAARLQPMLFRDGDGWVGLVVLKNVADPSRLAVALRDVGAATYVNVGREISAIATRYTVRAGRWLAIGAAAAVIVLAAGLRDPWRLARVLAPIAATCLVTLAVLTSVGERLSLIHIVSLQFVAGVGLDYALFFSRPRLDVEERARTLRTLVTCNAMTLLTFGILVFCRTPLLRQMGETVAVGAVTAMLFAFLFAGTRPERHFRADK